MDAELLKVVTSISTDAIKILGPAIITGFVGFKSGKVQSELRIKEVERNNKFKAHELLFNYYKEWQSHVSNRYNQLNDMFGSISGAITASLDKDSLPISSFAFKSFGSYVKTAPHDVDIALRDLETIKDKYKIEYDLLVSYKSSALSLRTAGNAETIFKTISDLVEIYGHLNRCANLIVEEKAKQSLSPYVQV